MSYDIEELIKNSSKINSLPQVFLKLNEEVNNPQCSFSDVADLIMEDPGLSSRLLILVNSSFYNFPQKIETITHAVSVVGMQQLRDLALSTCVLNVFTNIPKDIFSIESFWKHSVATGITARVIAIFRRDSSPERLYTAGILHNIGRLILYSNYPELIKDIYSDMEEKESLSKTLEVQKLGFDHAQVGGAMAKVWNLAPSLVEVIEHHHDPSNALHYPNETAIVHLSDIIATAMCLGNSGELFINPLDSKAWDLIDLPQNLLPSIFRQVDKIYQETIELFF
jgi:HD-like signal output (HDOD) protein